MGRTLLSRARSTSCCRELAMGRLLEALCPVAAALGLHVWYVDSSH